MDEKRKRIEELMQLLAELRRLEEKVLRELRELVN
jgi:hypothetical protein